MFLGLLIACLGFLLDRDHAALKAIEIGQHQFGFHHFRIGQRIDAPLHMDDVLILETPQHMHDRIHFADIAEEFVA